jgi:hypothetical protein
MYVFLKAFFVILCSIYVIVGVIYLFIYFLDKINCWEYSQSYSRMEHLFCRLKYSV